MTSDNKKEIPLWLVSVWVSIGILILMVVWPMISNSIKEASIKPLKQVTHERVADMEQYVYDKVGPDIYFQEPEINEEEHTVVLKLIQNEGDMDYSRFNLARIAINDYLEQNPDYFLNDEYYIDLQYLERNKIPGDYVDSWISYSSNHFQFDGESINRSMNNWEKIDYVYDNICIVKSYNGMHSNAFFGSDDVLVMDLRGTQATCGDIITVISNIPSLQYVYISGWERENNEQLVSALQEIGSDVIILIEYKR